VVVIFRANDRAYLVLTIEVEAQRIQTIRDVANPEKLVRVVSDSGYHTKD